MQRTPRREFPKHLIFIRKLPSIIRGAGDVEAAHIRYADALYAKEIPGMAAKPDDCWVLPLTHDVHMAQHDYGDERAWWASHGINPLRIAALLFVHSGNEEAARTIIANARRLSC